MTARAVTRAFDRLRGAAPVSLAPPPCPARAMPAAMPAAVTSPRLPRAIASGQVRMGVWDALCWAFGAECARLDLDEGAALVVGADSVVLVERIGMLGCRVDGGGRSRSHPDADVIASYLAALPPGCGGVGMAMHIAALARAGRMPDAMVGVRPRCVPVGLRHRNQHGARAQVDMWPALGRAAAISDMPRAGGWGKPMPYCPVTWVPTGAQIMAARRAWRDWRLALFDLSSRLRSCARLDTIEITPDLPPAAPWDTGY